MIKEGAYKSAHFKVICLLWVCPDVTVTGEPNALPRCWLPGKTDVAIMRRR